MAPHVLVISNCYPNPYKPYACAHVKHHVEIHRNLGLQISVIAVQDSRQGFLYSYLKYLRLFIQLAWQTLIGNFDLIHAHWPFPSGFFGLLIRYIRVKPLVITTHGNFVDNFRDHPLLVRIIVRETLKHADRIIAVGEKHKKNVLAISNLPEDRVIKINMGVWLEQSIPDGTDAKQNFGFSPEELIILFIGDLLHHKGADILIKAAGLLRSRGERFRLIIGGQGSEKEKLRRMLVKEGLEEMVDLIDAVPSEQVFTWFSAADIVVVPSRTEAFGLVAIEGMACGTPVVGANVGGLAETIRHGENGFLFPSEDFRALADLIQSLILDKDLRTSVVENGYRTAAENDMRVQAKKIMSVYDEILTSG